MLDYAAWRRREMTLEELTADLTTADLRRETNEMVDAMLALIAGCTDANVVFVPHDPRANDTFAGDESERYLAWTLGHVIVHTTASAEESAALAAELARGVALEPRRSRYETPWPTVTTIAQCRQRLEESRRMRLGSLAMWPDRPHLENVYEPRPGRPLNCVGRFLFGLLHDHDHLGQIADVVAQARAERVERPEGLPGFTGFVGTSLQ